MHPSAPNGAIRRPVSAAAALAFMFTLTACGGGSDARFVGRLFRGFGWRRCVDGRRRVDQAALVGLEQAPGPDEAQGMAGFQVQAWQLQPAALTGRDRDEMHGAGLRGDVEAVIAGRAGGVGPVGHSDLIFTFKIDAIRLAAGFAHRPHALQ